jgi:hypothetical protein
LHHIEREFICVSPGIVGLLDGWIRRLPMTGRPIIAGFRAAENSGNDVSDAASVASPMARADRPCSGHSGRP